MTLLADLALRSSVMLAAGLVLSACLARRSAALRHRVLAAALAAAAVIVPASLALPSWTVTLPAPAFDAPPAVANRLAAARTAGPADDPMVAPPARRPEPPEPVALAPLVILVWLAGVAVSAGRLIAGLARVRRAAARAVRIADAEWLRILHAIAGRYGIGREIVVSRSDTPDLLATWGAVRPHVLLPRQAAGWTLDRVHVVFCHELAHIRRHDWLVQMGAETVRAILWFNPLAWLVCARLRRESEQACDDEVLRIGVGGRDYAWHLLELARTCRRGGSAWVSALPMAHPSTLERRITAMLNARLDRHAPSRLAIATVCAVLLLVALPASVLRARQAAPMPLTGTVYDASGGVLPGVTVTLIDGNQNAWNATTNARGRFDLPVVAAGKYVLDVAIVGFRSLRQEFELREARDWDRAVTLQVGELQETVMVRANRGGGAEAAPPAVVKVGGNIRAPMKIKDVRPTYPQSMRDAGLTGVVPLEAVIGRDGSVASVRVLTAQVHPDFAIAAVDTVRQWRFTPTMLNGAPVEVAMRVTITFDLE